MGCFILLASSFLSLKGQNSVITIDQIQEVNELGIGIHNKAITIDHSGFFWLGGDNGLFRFDGKRLESIGFTFVKAIEISASGKLLVLSDDGLFSITSHTYGWVLDTLVTAQPSISSTTLHYPKSLYEDKNGIIWIGENENVVKYERGQIHRFSIPHEQIRGFLRSSFFFVEDGYYRFWAISFKGQLHYYDRVKGTFEFVELPNPLDEVSSIVSMGDDRLWIGAGNGVFEVQVNEKAEITSFHLVAAVENVSQIEILDNFALIGTWQNGLFQLDPHGSFEIVEAYRYSDVIDIISDYNSIWIATNSDILVVNKVPFRVPSSNFNKRIPSISLLNDNRVLINEGWKIVQSQTNFHGDQQKLLFDSKKAFWINYAILDDEKLILATSEGIVSYSFKDQSLSKILNTPNPNLGEEWPNDMYRDSKNSIWISYRSDKAVIEISHDQEVHSWKQLKKCLFVQEDSHRTLFAAGNDATLFIKRASGAFDQIQLDFIDAKKPNIIDIAFGNNFVFLATDNGIYKFNNNELNQASISPQHITSGSYNSIALDKEGALWVGAPTGLKKIHNDEIVDFARSSGLPSREIIERGILVDHDNRIWCATAKGIANTEINFMSQLSSKPKITELKIKNKTLDVSGPDLGTFFSNVLIEMNLTTLFFPASKLKYYTLLKVDDHIIEEKETGSNVSFFGLSAGIYKLEVRAKQPGFKWSDPVFYTFSIKVHWYRTVWFIILLILLFSSLLFILFRLYNKRLRQLKENLEKTVKERTEEVNQQKNELITHQREIINQQKELIEKNKVLNETKTALTASEIQFLELKRGQMQRELDLKSKQLTSQTLNIARKNQQLLDLSESLKDLTIGNGSKDMVKSIRKLRHHIDSLLKQDDHWEDFRLYFEQVHTDFYSILKVSHPNLTSNDLKQCALVKLNLSLDDCAALVGVSSESIRISRYRIQKKIGLSSQNALMEYLLQL